MFGKSKIFMALAFVFTLIFATSFQPSVANAKTVTVTGNSLNGEFYIVGKGGWFNKQYSFKVTNKGPKQVAVYQILSVMGVSGPAYLGTLSSGQTKTISFKGKGNIRVGYAFQLGYGGSGSRAEIEISPPNGLSVQ